MTETAKALAEERRAHLSGRTAERKKDFAAARAEYQKALEARLAARALDPGHTDPAWLEDLKNLHAGVRMVQYSPELIASMDVDLENYYRQKLGEVLNSVFQVDLNDPAAAVRVPDEWRVTVEGVTPCLNCSHDKGMHTSNGCTVRGFGAVGDIQACECGGYLPEACRHAFEETSAKTRRCVGCGEQQQLFPKMRAEDSMAFQQLQREAKARP